jgi:uncharacterized protein (DUF305 family)
MFYSPSKSYLRLKPLFLVLFISAACTTQQAVTSSSQSSVFIPEQTEAQQELERMYWERIQAGRMKFVQADVDFMTGMIVHHSQAIVMAQLAKDRTESRAINVLAARIINAQNDEVALMQKWLRDRRQVVPIVRIEGVTMRVDLQEPPDMMLTPEQLLRMRSIHSGTRHTDGESNMPGMITQVQIEKLATLRGLDFDEQFLSYMIEHHGGAVFMITELFAADGSVNDEECYRLAVDIYAEQVTEIDMMKLMLEEIKSNRQKTE